MVVVCGTAGGPSGWSESPKDCPWAADHEHPFR